MGRVSLPSVPKPSYLAAGEFITQPVVGTGFYSDPNLLMSRNLDPHEDATAATVDAFMRICLPLSSGYGQQGPDIDAHVLDPLEPVSPGGGMALLRGQRFCVTPGPDGRTDAVAMAERLAQSPAMISYAGTYVAREPSWCGGGSKRLITATPDDLMVSSVAIASDDSFRGNGHCWVSERTAKYSLVVPALLQALKAAGRDFVPDPAIHDGTLLRQTALIEQRDGITRTILIAGPRGPLRQPHGPPLTLGPAVEIHILPDRFVTR